jgi:esterase/lipase
MLSMYRRRPVAAPAPASSALPSTSQQGNAALVFDGIGLSPDARSESAIRGGRSNRIKNMLASFGLDLVVKRHSQVHPLRGRNTFDVQGDISDFKHLSLKAAPSFPTIIAIGGLGESRCKPAALTSRLNLLGYGAEHLSLLGEDGDTSLDKLLEQGLSYWFTRHDEILSRFSGTNPKPVRLGCSAGGLLHLAGMILNAEASGPAAVLMSPIVFAPKIERGFRFLKRLASNPVVLGRLKDFEFCLNSPRTGAVPESVKNSFFRSAPLLSTLHVFALQQFVATNLHRITKPVLLVLGSEDPYLDLKRARALLQALPNRELFKLEVLPCGHTPSGDSWLRTFEYVQAFYSKKSLEKVIA